MNEDENTKGSESIVIHNASLALCLLPWAVLPAIVLRLIPATVGARH